MSRLVRIGILACAVFVAVELGPPIWKGNIRDGLVATGETPLHDKSHPPDTSPPSDTSHPERSTDDAPWGWMVIRKTDPFRRMIYGPFLTPEPECRGYERRFPALYVCVPLKVL